MDKEIKDDFIYDSFTMVSDALEDGVIKVLDKSNEQKEET